MDTKREGTEVKAKSWTRYLNPFYFEIRFLRGVFYANILACIGYACILLCMLTVLLPIAVRIAHQPASTMEKLNRVSDPVKLREQIVLKDEALRDAWKVNAVGIRCASFIFLGMIIVLLVNTAHLRKAHQLLIAKL